MNKPLLVIFITVFIDLIGFGMIIPLNPYLATEFGADPLQVGLLMTIYSLMQFLFAPFWGQISDRFGRRPVILLTLVGVALAHFGFAFADSYFSLFVARALAGFFGANIATAMAYIADVTPEKERSKGMGLIGAAFGLGFMLGPFFGGIFGQVGLWLGEAPPFGLSFAAVVAGIISLANFTFAFFILPESRVPNAELKTKRDYQQARPRFKLLLEHIREPVLGPLMVVFFLTTLALAHMEAALFLFVQDQFEWSLTMASFGFAYVGFIMVLTQGFLIRKMIPWLGERKLLLLGLALSALGLGGIGFSSEVGPLAIAVTLMALGTGFVNPAITGSLSLLASESQQGSVLGVNQSFSAMGRIIGPGLGGWFYRDLGPSFPFWVAALVTLGALGLVIFLYRRLPESGKASRGVGLDVQEIGGFQLENLQLNRVPFLFFALCDPKDLAQHPRKDLLSAAQVAQPQGVRQHLEENKVPLSQPLVLICPDGRRSSQLAWQLEKEGHVNVYVLEGGLKGLEAEPS